MSGDVHRQLYPFLYGPAAGASPGEATDGARPALLEAVRESTLQKARDVVALRRRLAVECRDDLVAAAAALAASFRGGGKLLAAGNGGSATDAQDAAADCLCPPFPGWRVLPALALPNDVAVVTAIGNDVGFDEVFARQVAGLGSPGDVLLAFTTSGSSRNIVAALAEARRQGLRTIVLVGDQGGAIARDDAADFCFIAPIEHIPRIQEGHATLWHTLLFLTQTMLREG
jgi:D-sedoheptulose 7-phosphate isomerase